MTQKQITQRLSEASVPDAAFDAAELICHFEKVNKAVARVGDFSSAALTEAVNRRISGEPLQYILGEWDFYGYTFKVTPDCLIPRFDTEILCEYIVKNLPYGGKFADLCTGSGCIAISALKKRSDAIATAVELYPKTLAIAKENAERLSVSKRLEFTEADVNEDVLCGEYDIIASNPPYVTAEEMKELPREVKWEPPYALTDGGNGLSIIENIITNNIVHIKGDGAIAIEIGCSQGAAVSEMAKKRGLSCEILKDTGDRDRVAIIKKI